MGSFKKPEFEFTGVKVIQDKESAAVVQAYTDDIDYLKSEFNSKFPRLIKDLRVNPSGEIEIDFDGALNLASMHEAILKVKSVMG